MYSENIMRDNAKKIIPTFAGSFKSGNRKLNNCK